jgi:hypothetical protein
MSNNFIVYCFVNRKMLAMDALNIYYKHWGLDEIKAQRQGIQSLQQKLKKLDFETPQKVSDLLGNDWVDIKESVWFWTEMSNVFLDEIEYTRRTTRGRIAKNLNLPTPYLIYKLRIDFEMLRQIDAIVALL